MIVLANTASGRLGRFQLQHRLRTSWPILAPVPAQDSYSVSSSVSGSEQTAPAAPPFAIISSGSNNGPAPALAPALAPAPVPNFCYQENSPVSGADFKSVSSYSDSGSGSGHPG